MVAPTCLCNTCKFDTEDGVCCKKHGHAKCLIERCPDYEKEVKVKPAKTEPSAQVGPSEPSAEVPDYDF